MYTIFKLNIASFENPRIKQAKHDASRYAIELLQFDVFRFSKDTYLYRFSNRFATKYANPLFFVYLNYIII